jgi:anti-sigma B factor antagonist
VDTSEYRDPDGATVLSIAGEVDLAVATQVRDSGVAALARDESALLRIDLSGVTFMDSSGLGALIQLNNANPGRVVLVRPSARVVRLLELAGLTDTLVVEPVDSPESGESPRGAAQPG